jgi:hypothetical protein
MLTIAIAAMKSNIKILPLLERKFSVLAAHAVSDNRIEALSNVELLAKAARWQGYTILDGFVPVRKMNHNKFAMLKRNKRL